ncbi:hypothetical protein [Pedococcus sp.]|jgi:hypothetical protein|uniref:hypothetical protein n=1 Tax=Pedococcus sp. TaxID=2860345 RepID=UPI002E107AD2|nr:hypothetical protein [Pedococcus sp.]
MPPASARSADLRRRAESLASLAACSRTGADQLRLLYPEVGDLRVQAVLERALDDMRDLLAAVDVAATELADDLAVLPRQNTIREDGARDPSPTPRGPVRR